LEDDLRIDFSVVENIDLDIIRQCVEVGRKKVELGMLEEFWGTINYCTNNVI
jgi:hypothetical protein